jgi:hypothetical protein
MALSAAGYVGLWVSSDEAVELPFMYISGSNLTWLTNSTIRIEIGEMRDDSDSADFAVTAALTADITATGANGRNIDTAEQANKWYSVNVIRNPTTGTLAAFLINEDDVGAFTYPAGYTQKRRVGWVRNNNASNFRYSLYMGDGSWRQIIYDVDRNTQLQALNNANAVVFTNVDLSEWVPPTENHVYLMSEFDPFGTSFVAFRPNGSTVVGTVKFHEESTEPASQMFDMETDSNQIIEYVVGGAADDEDLFIVGYYDTV